MIHRAPRPTSKFTTISNDIIRHPEMSWEARMVLIYILSMPDNFTITQKKLNETYKRGRRFYEACVNEMRKHGYAGRRPRAAEKGQWRGQDYEVHDEPQQRLIDQWYMEQHQKAIKKQRKITESEE